MNITPLQYAKALLSATEHTSEQETQDVVGRFAERLQRDGRTRDLPRIIDAFAGLWNTAHGVVDAQVTSRVKLGTEETALIERSLGERYHADKVIITNIVDAAIGGGIIIRVGDELLDGSVATQLKKLQKELGGH